MRKIVLIEPRSKEDHVYKHVCMPRLGLPILGTQLQQEGYEVSFYLGTVDSLPWPKIFNADLVGISTTTATCREGYQAAGLLRSSGVPVVIGGIHASFLPDEALRFADYVVRGEAEDTFLPLVRSIEKGEFPADIPGVSYWQENRPVHNPPQRSSIEMDDLPIPDLNLLDQVGKMRSIPVMTSRGCPYDCTFCCVTRMFGRRYRYRCIESVIEELTRYRGEHIFFCDDNFVANTKHSRELMQQMTERSTGIKSWGAQVRADVACDDDLIALMAGSGCSVVYIGFESINPETLKSYNKQQTVEDIKNAIERFHHYGISIHGMFVFGGDTDTPETMMETAEFALETGIDTVQFMVLTPMPGTPFFEQLEREKRIITYDWSLYDGHHVVFKPAKMPAEKLQAETVRALKRFYSLSGLFRNVPVTGWSSALYRGIGFGLTRHFAYSNRWYNRFLSSSLESGDRPVTLLYRMLKAPGSPGEGQGTATSSLRISLTEQRGILYLKLRGLAGSLHLKELNRTIKRLPGPYSQMVVNTEGLRFLSEKAAVGFAACLEKMSSKVRRLQVVTAAEKQARSLLKLNEKGRRKLPRFELLLSRR